MLPIGEKSLIHLCAIKLRRMYGVTNRRKKFYQSVRHEIFPKVITLMCSLSGPSLALSSSIIVCFNYFHLHRQIKPMLHEQWPVHVKKDVWIYFYFLNIYFERYDGSPQGLNNEHLLLCFGFMLICGVTREVINEM